MKEKEVDVGSGCGCEKWNIMLVVKLVLFLSLLCRDGSARTFQEDIQVPDDAPSDYLPFHDVTRDDDVRRNYDVRRQGDVKVHHRTRRHAQRLKQYLWHAKVIPYTIDKTLGRGKRMILSAIKEFEQFTCLKFRRRNFWDSNWIVFQNGPYCTSSVGLVYWKSGPQNITLNNDCLHKQIILHEIMHSLGFWHEHSRPDRYKYIEVMWENIKQGAEENFIRYNGANSDTLGTEYDYNSILHYNNYAYSANKNPTIKVITSLQSGVGATSSGLSKGDILKINTLYDCTAKEVFARRRKRGYLSKWSAWSPCDVTTCSKYRQRVCFGRKRSLCRYFSRYGVQTQKTMCSQEECYAPIDGHWGRWSHWSSCHNDAARYRTRDVTRYRTRDVTRYRTRVCNDPTPRYGGQHCTGDATQHKICEHPTVQASQHAGLQGCNTALGFESGYFKDENFMATAYENRRTKPEFARLNNDSAWCVPMREEHKNGHFLQIRLPQKMKLTALAIQGHARFPSLVTSFRMYYRFGNRWKLYRYRGKKTVTITNPDARSNQHLIVFRSFTTDSIAINPRKWVGRSPCIRMELFGCPATLIT